MMPGINPKKIQAMMKQMGINQEELDAKRVIIEKSDGRIIIDSPVVVKINMQGNETFQVSGEIRTEDIEEEAEEEKLEADITAIMERTGCSRENAALEFEKHDGDLAETIIALTEKE